MRCIFTSSNRTNCLGKKHNKMKTYLVTYSGNSTKFRNLEVEVNADSERDAAEKVYGDYLDENYFPQDDGSVKDCSGNVIAEADDTHIEYDGGYFAAEEIED